MTGWWKQTGKSEKALTYVLMLRSLFIRRADQRRQTGLHPSLFKFTQTLQSRKLKVAQICGRFSWVKRLETGWVRIVACVVMWNERASVSVNESKIHRERSCRQKMWLFAIWKIVNFKNIITFIQFATVNAVVDFNCKKFTFNDRDFS